MKLKTRLKLLSVSAIIIALFVILIASNTIKVGLAYELPQSPKVSQTAYWSVKGAEVRLGYNKIIEGSTISCESNSMFPGIDCDDVVWHYKPSSIKEINPGDIITFEDHDNNGMEVMHRVMRVKGNVVWTKGDNNGLYDRPVPFKDVTGIVLGVAYNAR